MSTFHSTLAALQYVRLFQTEQIVVTHCGWPTKHFLGFLVFYVDQVMAGSGYLSVLRLCRCIHSRVGGLHHGQVTYGSHMAVSMAIGLIFLGGGKLVVLDYCGCIWFD